MKEIFYNGNLKIDIERSKSKYSKKIIIAFCTVVSLMSFFIILLLLNGVIGFSLKGVVQYILLFIVNTILQIPFFHRKLKNYKRNFFKKQLDANNNLNNLSKELLNEDIEILEKDFQKAIEHTDKFVYKPNFNIYDLLFKEDKLIRYFHLLDRNYQYFVLKQVRISLFKNPKVFLLEKEELQSLEYRPSIRCLKLQKELKNKKL